ncbi:hypothetical protein NC652_003821 [Populus alba x Populus x berolinensis]|nr:hypothetical protein NC652_003821 [Populus alba x Populus x berolinensis]
MCKDLFSFEVNVLKKQLPLDVGIESLFYRQGSENGGLFSQPFLAAHAPPLSVLQARRRYCTSCSQFWLIWVELRTGGKGDVIKV